MQSLTCRQPQGANPSAGRADLELGPPRPPEGGALSLGYRKLPGRPPWWGSRAVSLTTCTHPGGFLYTWILTTGACLGCTSDPQDPSASTESPPTTKSWAQASLASYSISLYLAGGLGEVLGSPGRGQHPSSPRMGV